MLKLDNIKAVYGGVVSALDEVSMNIEPGKIVVLLGNNGAGKSTTLKSISGVLRTEQGEITEGQITFEGKRLDKLEPEQIARLGICHVLQGRSVFPQLTAQENLMMGAYLRRDGQNVKDDLKQVYRYFPILASLAQRKSGYLSGGEQQMLVIGRALMGRPRVILLDEPSLGLAPRLIRDIFAVLKQINQESKTSLLIAEQNAGASLAIADYAYILQNGRVVASGTVEELKDQPIVRGAYLGLQRDGTVFSRHYPGNNGKAD